uniref:Uncharacterized protein n=1 Tax=Poecilia reticulata TaxID=8081 RepID=A0A3P9Q3T1_POERE
FVAVTENQTDPAAADRPAATHERVGPSAAVSRGRRSGVILPGGGGGGGGQDSDTILLESVKAAPRRSSIIKVLGMFSHLLFCDTILKACSVEK